MIYHLQNSIISHVGNENCRISSGITKCHSNKRHYSDWKNIAIFRE